MNHPKVHLDLKKHVKREAAEDENVIGIIASEHENHPKAIVLYVILNDKGSLRERNNFLLHDVGIEYYKNPVRQIKHNFKTEAKAKNYFTAEVFANSKILFSKSKKIDFLIKQAKLIIKKRR